MLDVGQGDAFLVVTPDRLKIIIDTGDGLAMLEDLAIVLGPLERNIDALFLSHPDMDHIGAARELVDRYNVRTVYANNLSKGSSEYLKLLSKTIDESNLLKEIYQGEVLQIGCCAKLDILWPTKDLNNTEINDTSLSFVLELSGLKTLFLGDLSKEYELQILDKLYDVDVLKVGHHGSNASTSDELVTKATPEVALVSVGEDNKYGHPDKDVINKLENLGIRVVRTDRNGRSALILHDGSYCVEAEKSLEKYCLAL
jgi:competence protein ComEC